MLTEYARKAGSAKSGPCRCLHPFRACDFAPTVIKMAKKFPDCTTEFGLRITKRANVPSVVLLCSAQSRACGNPRGRARVPIRCPETGEDRCPETGEDCNYRRRLYYCLPFRGDNSGSATIIRARENKNRKSNAMAAMLPLLLWRSARLRLATQGCTPAKQGQRTRKQHWPNDYVLVGRDLRRVLINSASPLPGPQLSASFRRRRRLAAGDIEKPPPGERERRAALGV
jgi:hypothetical protein